MANKWLIGGGLAAGTAAAIAVAALSGMLALPEADARQDEAKADVPPALEFVEREVVHPQLASMPRRVGFSGPLVAPAQATIRARLPGKLLSLDVAEGHRVRAGQVLGRIDDAEMLSRQAERAAMVASARASLAQAERSHASSESLAARHFISPVALEQSRAALEAARAQHRAAEAAHRTLALGLRDARLLAPIDGIVAKRHALPGEKLSAEQPVLSIVDIRQLELAAQVGTHEVASLAPGQLASLRVEGLEQPVRGRIARIAPAAEPGSRSIAVVVRVDNADERLRAGQYAMASVEVADEVGRLTLPATAVAQAGGQDHVWTIVDGALSRRKVTLGRRDTHAGRVEVLDGVGAQSVVLSARFDNLREGAPAKVVTARAPQLASAPASAPLVK